MNQTKIDEDNWMAAEHSSVLQRELSLGRSPITSISDRVEDVPLGEN